MNGQKRFKPGWYIYASPIQVTQGVDPFLENNLQHFSLIGYADAPIDRTYVYDGKTIKTKSTPLSNGQYAISFDTSNWQKGRSVNPFGDTRMKGYVGDGIYDLLDDTIKNHTLISDQTAQRGVDTLNATSEAHPASRIYALATFNPADEKEMARFNKGVDSVVKRSLRHHGYLGNWNILPSTNDARSRNTCVSWVHYLTRGLIDSGAIPEPDWRKFPARMSGFANEDFTKTHDRYEDLYGPFQPGS